jgi:hypothetical protein
VGCDKTNNTGTFGDTVHNGVVLFYILGTNYTYKGCMFPLPLFISHQCWLH